MANVSQEISKVRSKANSYKTAFIKTQPQNGWTHWILGYSKSSGICTVLVQSPYCPYGELGTAYFSEIAGLPVDPSFVETPVQEVQKKLR